MRPEKPRIVFYLSAFIIASSMLNSSTALASITRTRTMGDVGMILRDNANHWLFPSAILYQTNYAILELGGTPELFANSVANYGFDQWTGGVIRLRAKSQVTLGLFFSEAANLQLFQALPSGGLASRKFDFFFAKTTLCGSFGLQLSRASKSVKSQRDPGTDSKTSVTQTKLEFGFSGQSLDVAFGYQLSTSTSGNDETFGHVVDIRARKFKKLRSKLELVPFADLSIAIEERGNIAGAKAFIWSLWTGAGLQYQVDEGNLVVLGMSVKRFSQSMKIKISGAKSGNAFFDLPFVFAGLESELFPWLRLRFGMQKSLRWTSESNEYSNTSSKDVRTESPFAISAGLGLEYKRFTLDFSWDSDFLNRGPYFLSGQKGEMFNLISIEYQF